MILMPGRWSTSPNTRSEVEKTWGVRAWPAGLSNPVYRSASLLVPYPLRLTPLRKVWQCDVGWGKRASTDYVGEEKIKH
jgi:hypothetical protein